MLFFKNRFGQLVRCGVRRDTAFFGNIENIRSARQVKIAIRIKLAGKFIGMRLKIRLNLEIQRKAVIGFAFFGHTLATETLRSRQEHVRTRPPTSFQARGPTLNALPRPSSLWRPRKTWTKAHQQPWSDVFEGVEGEATTRPGSVFASGL